MSEKGIHIQKYDDGNEAVHLGLDYYYMGPKDRRTLTKEDYELAKRILPTLPKGWYRERHEWDAAKW